MRTFFRILPAALLALVLLPSPVPLAAQSEQNRYALYVDGLSCPFCAYGIEKHLHRVDGVATLETDIASGRVLITMAPGKSLSRAAAIKAVRDAGFTYNRFEPVDDSGAGG